MSEDLPGFDEFVAARGQALFRSAFLLTGGNAHDAQDLVQSALLRVVPRWSRIRTDPEAYVRRVIFTEHVNGWRRRSGRDERPRGDVPELVAPGPDHPEQLAARLALQDALLRLAPRQRAVVVLRYYEDLSEAQTAELLGCSIGTVKRQNSRALERLRQLAPGLSLDPSGAHS